MNDIAEKCKTSEEIRADLAALNLRLAFQEELEDEVRGLVQESSNPDPKIVEIMDRADSRIIHMFRRKLRQRTARNFVVVVIPKVGKVVAACLLVFFVGLSTAVATVPSVRIEVLNFIMKIEDRYTSLGFESSGKYIEVPKEWNGYYYMAYIPEGFRYIKTEGNTVYYERDGQNLIFSEHKDETWMDLDTEDAMTKFVDLDGKSVLIIEKNGWTTLAWAVTNRYFIIEMQGSANEAIEVEKAVAMIR